MYSQLYMMIACLAIALAAGATYALVTDGGRLEATTAAAIQAAQAVVPEAPTRAPIDNAPPKPALPPIAEHLRAHLADSLDRPIDEVVVVNVERATWPDGCLGLGSPTEMCTLALVEGYRIVLSVGFGRYTYRSNLDGSVVRSEP